MQVTLNLTKPNGSIRRYTTKDKINRFFYKLRHDKFTKAYLKVSYGKQICNLGCKCEFYNDGEYSNSKEALKAYKMFLGEG